MQADQGATREWVKTHDRGATKVRAADARFDDRFKPFGVLCAAALAILAACPRDDERRSEGSGDDAAPAEASAPDPAADALPSPADASADASPPAPSYPATTEGLADLAGDLLEAAVEGDRARAYELADSLRLEQPAAYFTRTFGPELGNQLATDYRDSGDRIRELVPLLRELADAGKTEIRTDIFDVPSEGAVGYQSRALERMITPTPLYSVRLVEAGAERGFHLWSFIHDGESFRWVGKMRRVAPGEDAAAHVADLPEDAEIPLDGGLPDLLELPVEADVRGSE